MSEVRNLNSPSPALIISFPVESLPEPLGAPEFYVRRVDDIESIATPFAHDEHVRRISERTSEEIWRAKNHDIYGREAMLLKFDEIDLEYEPALQAHLGDQNIEEILISEIPSPKILREIKILFQLAEKHEAIMQIEQERIAEEKRKRILDAQEFFIRGLVASVPDNELLVNDDTDF
jgi:hypothetical protein